MRTIMARPLTAPAFAPFGDVIALREAPTAFTVGAPKRRRGGVLAETEAERNRRRDQQQQQQRQHEHAGKRARRELAEWR